MSNCRDYKPAPPYICKNVWHNELWQPSKSKTPNVTWEFNVVVETTTISQHVRGGFTWLMTLNKSLSFPPIYYTIIISSRNQTQSLPWHTHAYHMKCHITFPPDTVCSTWQQPTNAISYKGLEKRDSLSVSYWLVLQVRGGNWPTLHDKGVIFPISGGQRLPAHPISSGSIR